MYKNATNELLQTEFGYLTAIATRPGDGRLSITMGLANQLALHGERVCFCSFSQGKMLKKHVPLPCVQVLPPTADLELLFDQLHGVLQLDTFLFVDNVTAMMQTEGDRRPERKTEVLTRLRECAVRYDAHVVVSDLFAHGWDGDNRYPIPREALALCDHAYIAYKDPIGPEMVDGIELPVIQWKKIV